VSVNQFQQEVATGQRFEFGKNWQRFLATLDDERIAQAESSLKEMLQVDTLAGKRVLDIGSGSGLFSLAAMRLGAVHVHSFDYDVQSVACTQELKRRYFAEVAPWRVEQGNVLEKTYLAELGTWDIVYSWGVLHHTGQMWQALENVVPLVGEEGKLFIAIYNDQGAWSRYWKKVKRIYNGLPSGARLPFALLVMGPRELKSFLFALAKLQPLTYIRYWTQYRSNRGMSRWHDLIDWIGGYPFEVAKPEEIFYFYRAHGFTLLKLKTDGGGLGCNEFVFERSGEELGT